MIEGLWIVRFITPGTSEGDLNGGAVVIETNRVLGGDSGYYYIGDVGQAYHDKWPLSLRIHRHDPQIESVFGDLDHVDLTGHIEKSANDKLGRPAAIAILKQYSTGPELVVKMTRVADLP